MTATGAFVTSLLTSFTIFCALVVAFVILSKWKANYNIYYPVRLLAGTGPPGYAKRRRNLFGWVKEAIATPQDELVRVAGLDAAIYLNFFTAGQFLLFIWGCSQFGNVQRESCCISGFASCGSYRFFLWILTEKSLV